jgi:hypothetical protein
MALRALKIIEEEIKRCRGTLEDGTPAPSFSAAGVNDRLDSLEARIRDRIEKELIEIPTCRFCGEPESDCDADRDTYGDGIQAHDFTPN